MMSYTEECAFIQNAFLVCFLSNINAQVWNIDSFFSVNVCRKGKSWVGILILHDVLTYLSVFSSTFKPYFLI